MDLLEKASPHALELAIAVLSAGWFWQLLDKNAGQRRDHYANAVRTLIEFQEIPYRVTRRTSDEPGVMMALTDRGHAVQEQLAYWRAWIRIDSPTVAEVFDDADRCIRGEIRKHLNHAWNQPPITTPAGMITVPLDAPAPLYDLAICAAKVNDVMEATRWRFGWRRPLSRWFVRVSDVVVAD